MIAASDYLFYDIPLENVQAIVKRLKNTGASNEEFQEHGIDEQ